MFRKLRQSTLLSTALVALAAAAPATVAEAPMLDCPLRDAPFTLDSPLIDLLLNEQAFAALQESMPAVEHFPERMLRTETPSFAAILNPRSLAGMTRTPGEALEKLGAKLAGIAVTDADRQARCARYDDVVPAFDLPEAPVSVLVFNKINGFDHGPSVGAATDAISAIAGEQGWALAVTDKGGAFNPDTLSRFDVVVWNNVSGDVLTLSQRAAFQDYMAKGGGFVGIHGSGGDPSYFWDWYADDLLGARFIGHPNAPQFQEARIVIESADNGIGKSLAPGWTMSDEWYSFEQSARANGASVVATLDESTYTPEGMGRDLRMGEDHPIAWTRCVGAGRSFYSAIGHRPEVYQVAQTLTLLGDALAWAAGDGEAACSASK